MNKDDILKVLGQHGTAEQVRYVDKLSKEEFDKLEEEIRNQHADVTEAVRRCKVELAQVLDKSDWSDYIIILALYELSDTMRSLMPEFKDNLDAINSVDITHHCVKHGSTIRIISTAVERGMENDGDTTVQG